MIFSENRLPLFRIMHVDIRRGSSFKVRVKNRHVIYVQGYDPRGLAQYYRMFRTELRKFEKLYHLTTKIGRPQNITESEIASWTIET